MRIAQGGEGSLSVDVMHRQILDQMLQEDRWVSLKSSWGEKDLQDINLVWHRLEGTSILRS